MPSIQQIIDWLEEVPDPEIPVISVVDLGIVREVKMDNDKTEISITPTYSGCPASQVIQEDIIAKLNEKKLQNFKIISTLSPAWTTDWISEKGKQKLKEFGIAPPQKSADKTTLFAEEKEIECPKCNSTKTQMVSQFGSTPCKALYKCLDCMEPFDYFKCI